MKITFMILGVTLALALSMWFGWIVWTALHTGVACIAGGKELKRKSNPLGYWTTVIFQVGFALMFLVVGIMRLSGLQK